MKQILVDMDGVLADIFSKFRAMQNSTPPAELKLKEASLKAMIEANIYPHITDNVQLETLFRDAPRMAGSVGGLKYLNDKYKVLIVSAATELPDIMKPKMEWLAKYFPFISWKQVIFCGVKDSIKGDIMIDDEPQNLDVFDGRKILFTQFYNVNVSKPGYTRVDNWAQIQQIL